MRQIDKKGSFFLVRWYKELNYLTKERIKSINESMEILKNNLILIGVNITKFYA